MKEKIEEGKLKIEDVKEILDLMEREFMDKGKYNFLLLKFVNTMNARILFCEELVNFIDKSNHKEDVESAKEKILEILEENIKLGEKWILYFKEEKGTMIIKKAI